MKNEITIGNLMEAMNGVVSIQKQNAENINVIIGELALNKQKNRCINCCSNFCSR